MKDPEFAEVLKAMGVEEEDLPTISPEMEDNLKKMGDVMEKYKLVFEVVKSRNCLAGVQVGQKIVIDSSIIVPLPFVGATIPPSPNSFPWLLCPVFPTLPAFVQNTSPAGDSMIHRFCM